ncbi:hypothetical protein [Clostridium estertheticum]|uniref:hypothetical protein n=1 Tax=Clostridium estertheticum TaxID=238834 RepID=UPI001C0AFA50|nr:hypothetical protein [Clostridium estertheticum]MBU3073863.1 hypothetical protein [Clostridium estertheticum]MBU3163958.1 hypothetical protein [Clostridium estertheticum]
MKKELDKFINELSEKYSSNLTKKEIKTIIECDSAIDDMPVSTGKRLVVQYLSIFGEKNSGEKIDFQKKFEEGVNIIIADNLRGKSTIFKVLKTALVGDQKSIKADVKEWIKNIVVGFRISKKEYTITITMEGRFKGKLYNASYADLIKSDYKSDNIVFEANDNKKYCEEMQRFFFNQFSYYSLKWTQKTSSKGSSELLEASASWKTYFKAIYLESKDSNSFYGAQDQKIFQMLLGLVNTHLINQLTIKKDMQQYEVGKQKEYDNKNVQVDDPKQKKVDERLDQVRSKLKQIKNNSGSKELYELQKEHKALLCNMNINNDEILGLRKAYKIVTLKQKSKLQELDIFESEERRISREITKNKKLLIDLKEYIEVAQFFSNLNIKYCPSCNHEMDNKKNTMHGDTCPLCRETVIKESDNKQNYILKIRQLEVLLNKLDDEKDLLFKKNSTLRIELQNINIEVESTSEKTELLENNKMEEELADIDVKLELSTEKNSGTYEQEKLLIAEEAVLLYKKTVINEENVSAVNLVKSEAIFNLLNDTIKFLDTDRYERSKSILDTLSNIMLNEIHEFGLNSITDIKIDNKINITYVQNNIAMKFDDIAEGEQLRAKLAFYLALIQMDIEKNFGRHTRFLIIDSPNKEEGDATYLEGLKQVLLSINNRYEDSLQILIGTATREFEDIIENQTVYLKGEYVF